MTTGEPLILVIVSDLHMADGGRGERFHDDEIFARFLDWLAGRVEPGRSHLLLLGDLFDLLEVTRHRGTTSRAWRDMSEAASRAKLEVAFSAHARAMAALAEIAAAGVAVSIVPGNHDVDLVRPSVQRHFRELLAEHCREPASAHVEFHPWIFYLPGLVYAEHGNQYHDLNAFRSALDPTSPNGGELELPLGSELALCLVDLEGARDEHGRLRASAAPEVLASGSRLGGAMLARWLAPVRGNRSLPVPSKDFAERLGLPTETLHEIQRLAPLSRFAFEKRMVREQVVPRIRRTPHDVPADGSGYMQTAATAVHAALTSVDRAVPYYVFAHTHRAVDRPLQVGGNAPHYLNPGTWSSLVAPPTTPDVGHARFTFVEIEREAHGPVTARLLWWNDARRRPEPAASPAA